MLALQKQTVLALVNIFETGSVSGSYRDVTLIKGDAGHLTYGRSQTTLASGNLAFLVRQYCDADGASEAGALRPFLERLDAKDLSLDDDEVLKSALRRAGDDPVMHAVQDDFFDRIYWAPAERAAMALGIVSPLGVAVVYDSHIHGSWGLMRDRTTAKHGTAQDIGEKAWIVAYIQERRDWFAGHHNEILHKSVRRMDAFKALVDAENWDLTLSFIFRGVLVSEETIAGVPAPHVLRLGSQGDDVRKLQERLVAHGFSVDVDGDFGDNTETAVRAFQNSNGLEVDGIVGNATWSALG